MTDSYFAQNSERFTALKTILDGEGKEYKTAFRDDSLIKRWFEGIIYFDDAETKSDGLADLVRDYKLILDAELLTADDAPEFAKAFTEALLDEHDKVIVPFRSIEALGANAYQAKKILNRMHEADVLQIHGEKTDPDFRDTVIEVFKRFRNVCRLCLLTSDENLAQEILQLNDSAEESDFETSAVCLEEGKVKFYERLKDTELNEDDLESWEEL